MIRNSSLEELDVFIVHARPEPKINESSSSLLNGGWFIQTIGEPSEILKVKMVCKWSIVKQILNYAVTKEKLTIEFMDTFAVGYILGIPSYDMAETDDTDPKYIMTFDLAVMPDV